MPALHLPPTRSNRRVAAVSAAALVVLTCAAAYPAHSAVVTNMANETSNTAAEGALTWGFKESFRSYISGTIAKGEWETLNGASYETPQFSWPTNNATFDVQTLVGDIEFVGDVHFTGHKGLLDTTISHPTLRLDGSDTAILHLDVAGVTMDAAMSGEDSEPEVTEDVPFAAVNVSDLRIDSTSDTVTVTGEDMPAVITEEGAVAFPNYEAGSELDLITVVVDLPVSDGADAVAQDADTTAEGAAATQDTGTPADAARSDEASDASAQSRNLVPAVAAGAGAVALIGVVGVVLMRKRARS
ncbi:HtaA domain-containing protein [Jonesia quinghaiensis]|uniref:HtaA domain-containing protein n=1 Tax=Jonesia quinghaiensis TaxID=262806 RepID=UPI000426995D|nr:HtaA domain-containing protein [Jonesia quinghaiensis]